MPSLIRLFRARRRMSQREFAELAGMPRSTIDRLEAGRSEPKVGTLFRLAALAGCRFAVVDRKGRRLAPDREREKLIDDRGRHFPAHLPAGKVVDYYAPGSQNWWGWERIAWPGDPVPEYTYWRRRRCQPDDRWDDVT